MFKLGGSYYPMSLEGAMTVSALGSNHYVLRRPSRDRDPEFNFGARQPTVYILEPAHEYRAYNYSAATKMGRSDAGPINWYGFRKDRKPLSGKTEPHCAALLREDVFWFEATTHEKEKLPTLDPATYLAEYRSKNGVSITEEETKEEVENTVKRERTTALGPKSEKPASPRSPEEQDRKKEKLEKRAKTILGHLPSGKALLHWILASRVSSRLKCRVVEEAKGLYQGSQEYWMSRVAMSYDNCWSAAARRERLEVFFPTYYVREDCDEITARFDLNMRAHRDITIKEYRLAFADVQRIPFHQNSGLAPRKKGYSAESKMGGCDAGPESRAPADVSHYEKAIKPPTAKPTFQISHFDPVTVSQANELVFHRYAPSQLNISAYSHNQVLLTVDTLKAPEHPFTRVRPGKTSLIFSVPNEVHTESKSKLAESIMESAESSQTFKLSRNQPIESVFPLQDISGSYISSAIKDGVNMAYPILRLLGLHYERILMEDILLPDDQSYVNYKTDAGNAIDIEFDEIPFDVDEWRVIPLFPTGQRGELHIHGRFSTVPLVSKDNILVLPSDKIITSADPPQLIALFVTIFAGDVNRGFTVVNAGEEYFMPSDIVYPGPEEVHLVFPDRYPSPDERNTRSHFMNDTATYIKYGNTDLGAEATIAQVQQEVNDHNANPDVEQWPEASVYAPNPQFYSERAGYVPIPLASYLHSWRGSFSIPVILEALAIFEEYGRGNHWVEWGIDTLSYLMRVVTPQMIIPSGRPLSVNERAEAERRLQRHVRVDLRPLPPIESREPLLAVPWMNWSGWNAMIYGVAVCAAERCPRSNSLTNDFLLSEMDVRARMIGVISDCCYRWIGLPSTLYVGEIPRDLMPIIHMLYAQGASPKITPSPVVAAGMNMFHSCSDFSVSDSKLYPFCLSMRLAPVRVPGQNVRHVEPSADLDGTVRDTLIPTAYTDMFRLTVMSGELTCYARYIQKEFGKEMTVYSSDMSKSVYSDGPGQPPVLFWSTPLAKEDTAPDQYLNNRQYRRYGRSTWNSFLMFYGMQFIDRDPPPGAAIDGSWLTLRYFNGAVVELPHLRQGEFLVRGDDLVLNDDDVDISLLMFLASTRSFSGLTVTRRRAEYFFSTRAMQLVKDFLTGSQGFRLPYPLTYDYNYIPSELPSDYGANEFMENLKKIGGVDFDEASDGDKASGEPAKQQENSDTGAQPPPAKTGEGGEDADLKHI